MNPIKRIIQYTRHYGLLSLVLLFSVLRTVRDIFCLVAMSIAIDALLAGGSEILAALVFMACAELSGIPILSFHSYLVGRYQALCERALLDGFYVATRGAALEWVEALHVGDYFSAITSDLAIYLNWAGYTMPNAVREGAYIIGGVLLAFLSHAGLSLWVFPIVLLILPATSLLCRPLLRMTEAQRQIVAQSQIKVQEILSNPEVIKAYSLESQMDEQMKAIFESLRQAERKIETYTALINGVGRLGSFLPSIVALVAGLFILARGEISVGFLFAFVQMTTQRFARTLQQASDIIARTNRAAASAKRIAAILDAPGQRTGALIPEPGTGDAFALNGVCFTYPSGNEVLWDINLSVGYNETVAIVGPSGSGKSTVLKLLMGVYAPSSGEILCDGVPVERWNTEAYRRRIAPVFQSTYLFPMTIHENLSVNGQPDAPDVVRGALARAGLLTFIDALPAGIHTVLAQRGDSLSGGQKQRLSIARGWLKHSAEILMMDEPSSALDSVTDLAFQRSLSELSEGKTTIIVTHKLLTVKNADRIYVMEGGKVVQQGRHSELVSTPGVYQMMYEAQEKGAV